MFLNRFTTNGHVALIIRKYEEKENEIEIICEDTGIGID